MPYKLRKAPNRDLYWVVTTETKKKHSKEPIPIEKAKAQMRILESALHGGGSGKWTKLIKELGTYYSIPKALVDGTIEKNDLIKGAKRFGAKKHNIFNQFSDYIDPQIKQEIADLDEEDPNSVNNYAESLLTRVALKILDVKKQNPLHKLPKVETKNPLHGGKRKRSKKLHGGSWEQIRDEYILPALELITRGRMPFYVVAIVHGLGMPEIAINDPINPLNQLGFPSWFTTILQHMSVRWGMIIVSIAIDFLIDRLNEYAQTLMDEAARRNAIRAAQILVALQQLPPGAPPGAPDQHVPPGLPPANGHGKPKDEIPKPKWWDVKKIQSLIKQEEVKGGKRCKKCKLLMLI